VISRSGVYEEIRLKILLVAAPFVGHANPVLVAARILKSAGHTTVVYTGTMFREKVEAAGAKFFPLPADVDFSPENPPKTPEPSTSDDHLSHLLKAVFADSLIPQYRGLQTVMSKFAPDLIVYEVGFTGMLPLLLGPRSARVPCALLGITMSFLPREDGAPFGPGLPPATSESQREQYKAKAAELDAQIWGRLRTFADEQLSEVGARKLPAPVFESLTLLADTILQTCAPSFEFPLRETSSRLHFIGALMPQGVGGVPVEIKEAKAAGRKIVLATQGTIANRDLGLLIGPTIEALGGREDVLIVATTGGPPVEQIPVALPANAIAFQFLNYSELLPLVDVLVALGGYGVVTQALSFGVPMVLAGTSEDKAENAARVAWNGAGIALSEDNPTPEQLREAVNEVLTTPGYRARAQKLAEEFARYDATRELPRLLEELEEAEKTSVTQGSIRSN
jgi:MGT family glycosyltransferase